MAAMQAAISGSRFSPLTRLHRSLQPQNDFAHMFPPAKPPVRVSKRPGEKGKTPKRPTHPKDRIAKWNISVGDTVQVLGGDKRYAGKVGTVLRCLRESNRVTLTEPDFQRHKMQKLPKDVDRSLIMPGDNKVSAPVAFHYSDLALVVGQQPFEQDGGGTVIESIIAKRLKSVNLRRDPKTRQWTWERQATSLARISRTPDGKVLRVPLPPDYVLNTVADKNNVFGFEQRDFWDFNYTTPRTETLDTYGPDRLQPNYTTHPDFVHSAQHAFKYAPGNPLLRPDNPKDRNYEYDELDIPDYEFGNPNSRGKRAERWKRLRAQEKENKDVAGEYNEAVVKYAKHKAQVQTMARFEGVAAGQ